MTRGTLVAGRLVARLANDPFFDPRCFPAASLPQFHDLVARAPMALKMTIINTQSTVIQVGIEEALLGVVRRLPPHRAVQVLDFARWLQTQPEPSLWLTDIEIEDLAAQDDSWNQFYLENRETFRAMAREALEQR
jgi:hypothetical protein